MGYLHIDNLYKNQSIFLFKECYALEKIHGTSAHISWRAEDEHVGFFSGEQHDKFVALFDTERLLAYFKQLGYAKLTVYGEAYGGKIQGFSKTYGPDIKFVVFDVKHGDKWLEVPHAHYIATSIGQEFVDYIRIPTDLRDIDYQRDRPSVQAARNGVSDSAVREGVVLRPIHEFTDHHGNRIIAKHKADAFRETTSVRRVKTDEEIRCLEHADEIANEWVTDMRMRHVIQAMGGEPDIKRTGDFIKAMVEDVCREASGEIVDSKEARKAIGAKAAAMYKQMIKEGLYVNAGQ